ncbi:MAG: RNA-directed DNA polymerase [Acidobacteria bacterium]|nr:RNA-directed DNA polymerase [Acidobacteriota bacterium]
MYDFVPAPLPSLHKWRKFFISRGVPEPRIQELLIYIKPLVKNRVPVIFNLEHLGRLLGRKTGYLAKIINSNEHFYRSFQIPKKNGAHRIINAPYPSLLECQRWINDNILSIVKIHDCAKGYLKNTSIIDHVEPHLGNNVVLLLDLKDFFPNITINRIIPVFRNLGYSQQVSLALSKICTLNDILPQGAASSPSLSNIICNRLDKRIACYSEKNDINYTRYADDLCFSSKHIEPHKIKMILKIINSEGFLINSSKYRLLGPQSSQKIITGINISNGAMKISNTYKRELSLAMYCIKKFGIRSHLQKLKIRDTYYLDSLYGKINYWLNIESTNKKAKFYKMFVRSLMQTYEP